MKQTITFKYDLPNRTRGSFASFPFGKVAEYLTLSWLRFNVSLLVVVVVSAALISPAPIETKLLQVALAVPAAFVIYPCVLVAVLICSVIPIVKVPIGLMRVLYYIVFSRLVVQKSPRLYIPAWF